MGITLSASVNANEAYISVNGSGVDLAITQDGDNNQVGTSTDKFSVNGTSNTLFILQEGQWNQVFYVGWWGSQTHTGGDIKGNNNNIRVEQYNTTGTDVNKVGMHIPSSDNNVHVCQGKSFDDAADTTCSGTVDEYGGHTAVIDLHGGGNDVKISQQSGTVNSDHTANIFTYGGDDNNIFVKQNGNGNKYLNMIVRTDGGSQSIIQDGSGAHTATIDLGGSYKTDLDLTQDSSDNKSYTLTQNCQTIGGCSLTVLQN
jgi:hypothetical protein